ncbi:hypothetical protein H0H92_005187 [Tricholoma furcatifolium]|nr:hypothetical protein H0H92_005187 [Tricholoma furcatifolium]
MSSQGSNGSTVAFKDAALDVVSAIEAPLDSIFDREATLSNLLPHTRPPKISRPLKAKSARNPNANFLYIRTSDLHPPYDENHPQTYLLRCPHCLRQTFTSLQGLFNHARISHRMEWGTHDECVRACAVLDPELNIEMGIEVGIGPNGILPGLRRIFEMAVGAHQPTQNQSNPGEHDILASRVNTPYQQHITKTLGLHENTPALATFLGKQAVRRSIKVWDEFVDIDGCDDNSPHFTFNEPKTSRERQNNQFTDTRRRWRMHFTHRNDFEPEIEVTSQEPAPTPGLVLCTNNSMQEFKEHTLPEDTSRTNHGEVSGSRFYFRPRISVVDRSFWIPPEKRESHGHTHKWMISVDAPSYSHHITSILKRLTVKSLSSSSEQLTTTQPPFLVVGTATEPFLAKVELHFSGSPGVNGEVIDQIVYLEHWVELDLMKSIAPVFGDEQMVDIELERGTILLPLQKGYLPITSKAHWGQTPESLQSQAQTQSQQDYSPLLEKLAERFPMVVTDHKANRQVMPQVPYKLVSRPEFDSFILGRKKAIEWSRARAIQEAYNEELRKGKRETHDFVPLTTADVYFWLAEEGHFIRQSAIKPEPNCRDMQRKYNTDHADVWCPACGQGLKHHLTSPAVKTDLGNPSGSSKLEPEDKPESVNPRPEPSKTTSPCVIAPKVSRMPMVDILSRLSLHNNSIMTTRAAAIEINDLQASTLVAASDAKVTTAIHDLVCALKLPTFPSTEHANTPYPLDKLGANHAQVENHLAPYATLAIVMRPFIQTLVRGGLKLMEHQKKSPSGNSAGAQNGATRRYLTPSHILGGMLSWEDGPSSQGRSLDKTIFEVLSRLGVTPWTDLLSSRQGFQTEEQEPMVPVKFEEE